MSEFTVKKDAESEFYEKRSRFIGHAFFVTTEEEAMAKISEVRAKYPDATHNCFAYNLRRFSQRRFSDDGEPQGTSGAPIVQMLVAQGITNVVVVVTRYFGGIKLGTGGLVRAYTSSAKLGLAAAGICDVCERSVLTYALDYTYLAKLQNLAAQGAGSSGDEPAGSGALFAIENLTYTDVVQAALSCVPERADEVKNLIANLTGGQGRLCCEETRVVRV